MAKVLIAEDDQILQKAYATVLRMEGFEIFTSSDGNEALKVAQEQNPDLILLDILMPTMDGIAFLRQYNVKEMHPNTKVIVFSNVMVQDKIDQAMTLGAKKYMVKSSFTPKEMVKVVKEVLESHPE